LNVLTTRQPCRFATAASSSRTKRQRVDPGKAVAPPGGVPAKDGEPVTSTVLTPALHMKGSTNGKASYRA